MSEDKFSLKGNPSTEELAIVKFLASELMKWEEVDIENITNENIKSLPRPCFWITEHDLSYCDTIDYWYAKSWFPMRYIDHAYMAEDMIEKMGEKAMAKYASELDRIVLEKRIFRKMFLLAHASPKQRTIAAARVLATTWEQLKEWGIDDYSITEESRAANDKK
ncbi:hypothetical protein LCGC14_0805380 [marine sediment metagenome]|uniref:Uncharacterized protein n=1 Tax=marine sediment metagenome TaxID=412755 RepID=A0A0F9SVP9_9ZZZZ